VNFYYKLKISVIIFTVIGGLLPVNAVCPADHKNKQKCQKEVVIQPGDTLSKICNHYLGKYDPFVLQKLKALNPQLTDPNRIIAGDSLCLPYLVSKIQSPQNMDEAQKELAPLTPSLQKETRPSSEKVTPISPETLSKLPIYPPPMPGQITQLKWTGDNTAIVEGRVEAQNAFCRFFVYVPGDLEYEQPNLEIRSDGTFQVHAVIGRQGRDYGNTFVLKLALFDSMDERIGEVRTSLIRQRHEINEIIRLDKQRLTRKSGPTGWSGVETWMAVQAMDAMQSDNVAFRVPDGRIVKNFRYLGYNPDERYLSRYGRITLYGSSCLAKALLVKGNVKKAEEILRPWAAQITPDGKVPRSANVVGDNYISPDVRTGEVAHFLGALAAAKSVTGSKEWDAPITNLVNNYLVPLTDKTSGLVRGGYNGDGNGYGKPRSYKMLTWCSAEHNFDLFQSLTLLARVYADSDLGNTCQKLASQIGDAIDQYLWDDEDGTFNQGWNNETGADQARALDCASWGALYLLKRARLAKSSAQYIEKAGRCLKYAERHFKTRWCYRTPEGETGCIEGYRPYHGKIPDVRYEDGPNAGKLINWSSLADMVWSEGTLGVAKAWEEFAKQTGDRKAQQRFRSIYGQMKKLQSLSDQGGILYSTRQIKGHFTMGEELASLSWLAYLSCLADNTLKKNDELVNWMPW
jgi:hypothetical protein